jgi:hypothetical protein
MTYLIAAIIVLPALYLLGREVRKEALTGKCAGCSQEKSCTSCKGHHF